MTLTERLTAILGSVPEAVEEYESFFRSKDMRAPLTVIGGHAVVRQDKADAALAALVDQFAKRIAELEAALAKARVGELEAMNVLEGTELKLKQAESALSFAAQRIVGGPPDAVDECLADLRARAAEEASK
jgi:hypothetical protein